MIKEKEGSAVVVANKIVAIWANRQKITFVPLKAMIVEDFKMSV